ncbi:MAG: helix-turn-helix domain-containing protein [Myxococcota bacterium]
MQPELALPRVVLVESDPALRSALARAIAGSGFEVMAAERVDPERATTNGPGWALHVVDLEAPGAEAWLDRPEGRSVSVFLACDAETAARVERRHGAEVDVLVKPFPVERLEARLVGRHRRHSDAHRPPLDPILQTRDPRFGRVLAQANRLAAQSGPICLVGELGTGRRALAYAIHAAGPRAGEPCTTLEPTDVLASPSDAALHVLVQRIASAGHGTLVVVEPAEWATWAQATLQAILRETGDDAGPRCVTITRGPLERALREGRIGAELAYRLAGPVLALPALRDRVADQIDYCTAVARRLAGTLGQPTPRVDRALVEDLVRAGFPGNRLGVEHRLRRALIGGEERDRPREGTAIEPATTGRGEPAGSGEAGEGGLDLRALERAAIVRALARMQGNRTHASRALGISVRTLRNKIREYGLR